MSIEGRFSKKVLVWIENPFYLVHSVIQSLVGNLKNRMPAQCQKVKVVGDLMRQSSYIQHNYVFTARGIITAWHRWGGQGYHGTTKASSKKITVC